MSSASTDQNRAASYVDPDTGFLMMPGTRRPDGTMRKPRRIKEGYTPQDEVPLYESKGKQWAKAKEEKETVLSSGVFNMKIDTFDSRKLQPAAHIPGLSVDKPKPTANNNNNNNSSSSSSSNKSKKKKKANNTVVYEEWEPPKGDEATTKVEEAPAKEMKAAPAVQAAGDPVKKLRNLRKKLRDIESLESKLSSGSVSKPEPEQLEKVARKAAVEKEIKELERVTSS